MSENKIIDVESKISESATKYDETLITANDFKNKINEIMEIIKYCSIKDLKNIFASAMAAREAPQDMSQFDVITVTYIDLFIRQITTSINMFDYDTLLEFYDYVIRLRQDAINKRA